jgi:HEAT repeat protein
MVAAKALLVAIAFVICGGVCNSKEESVADLIKALKGNDSKERERAAKELGLVGKNDREASYLSLWAAVTRDESKEVRISAGHSLVQLIGATAIPTFVQAIVYEKFEQKRTISLAALELPANRTKARAAVPYLLELLKEKDSEVRSTSVKALVLIMDKGIGPLIEKFQADEEPSVRLSAYRELATVEDKARGVWLSRFLQDKDAKVRGAAATALGPLNDPETVPSLIRLLGDEDSDVRASAANALATLKDKRAIPGLTDALRDKVDLVRYSASRAFENFGPDGKTAVPRLIEVFKENPREEHNPAFFSLIAIGSAAVPALAEICTDTSCERNIRMRAYSCLSMFEEKHRTLALKAFVEGLDDKDDYIRTKAIGAIYSLGQDGKDALPALTKLLKDGTTFDKLLGLRAILAVDPENPVIVTSVPVLIAYLKDDEWEVRVCAAERFQDLGPKARKAVPALIDALRDSELCVRRQAAKALGSMGPVAKEAVPALERALHDEEMNAYAKAALKRIRVEK